MPQTALDRKHQKILRDAEMAKLRARGWSYTRIAEKFGYADHAGARTAVQRAIAYTVREATDEARELALNELDQLAEKAWAVLEAKHYVVSNGVLVRIDGEPLTDHAPVLEAIKTLLKVQERKAKLVGLDAPTKHEHLHLDAIEAEIRSLEAQLGKEAAEQVAEEV